MFAWLFTFAATPRREFDFSLTEGREHRRGWCLGCAAMMAPPRPDANRPKAQIRKDRGEAASVVRLRPLRLDR